MYKAALDGTPAAAAAREGYSPEKEWRRTVVKYAFFALVGLGVLYEYDQHRPQRRRMTPPSEAVHADLEEHHHGFKFMKELQKAREAPEPEVTLDEAKEVFSEKYGDSAKPLLCSGCKLTAARIGEELHNRNATGQPDPTSLLSVMHEAVHAACDTLPDPLVISRGGRTGAFFGTYQAPDGHQLTGLEQRKAEVARKSAQTLCVGLLADTKLDFLEALIRRKVPHARGTGPGQAENDNWERWLCARHTRLCKRSEVEHDDEEWEDQDGEL